MSWLACRKYRRLSSLRQDGLLDARRESFLARHADTCSKCASYESESAFALNLLREITLDPEPSPGFDERTLRKVQLQFARSQMRYWSPAVVGAGLAGLIIVAALQMVALSSDLPRFHSKGAPEARRMTKFESDFPSIRFISNPQQ